MLLLHQRKFYLRVRALGVAAACRVEEETQRTEWSKNAKSPKKTLKTRSPGQEFSATPLLPSQEGDGRDAAPRPAVAQCNQALSIFVLL